MEIDYINAYDAGEAARRLYEFVWGEFCDWYIELSKVRLYGSDIKKKRTIQYLLWNSLKTILKMLHPYIPFATEEIYSYMPFVHGSLITSEFPLPKEEYIDDKVEHNAEFVFEMIRGIRSLKTELGIPIVTELKAYFTSLDEHEKELINAEKDKIMKIAKVSTLENVSEKPSRVLKTVVSSTTVYLELPFDVDMAKERERFEKTLKDVENELKSINSRLLNRAYLEKALPEVIKKDRDRLEELEKTKGALLSHIEDLGR